MAKRNNDDEYGVSQDDPFSWLSCIVALGLGIAMIAIESTKGQNCKMRDVDSFAWNDPEAKGQIPIVIQAQGIFFLMSSLFYIFGRVMRKSWRPLGSVLTGFCGKMFLFVLWIFSFFLSLLGFFWMYVANWQRNNDNSTRPGDPNYCAPEVWYSSYTAIYLFWIFSGIMGIASLSRIYYLLLGAQYTRQKSVILRNSCV